MNLDILIVDDHEAMRTMLRTVFQRSGLPISVREAMSGAEALARMQEHGADLVLCDQNMPGMSGLELVAALRAGFPQTRILMLSGKTGTAFTRTAQTAGTDLVLVKPILPSNLLQAIAQVMQASPDARAAVRA